MKFLKLAVALACVGATPAFAQEAEAPEPFTVSGSVALVTDYRYRGVSQSDKEFALQGGVTVTHESGVYAGMWASNLAGWGTFGGPNLELDVFGGYKFDLGGGAALDVGLTWYMYPGGAAITDFAEPYVKLSGTTGPLTLLAGAAYAPKQEALGRWFNTGLDAAGGVPNNPGAKDDNIYLWGDAAVAVPGLPLTAKAHIGYSDGNPGLGPNGTSVAPTGSYWDWSIGLDYAVVGPLTLGVAYVDTDITDAGSNYLRPNFQTTDKAESIADAAVVFSLSAAF